MAFNKKTYCYKTILPKCINYQLVNLQKKLVKGATVTSQCENSVATAWQDTKLVHALLMHSDPGMAEVSMMTRAGEEKLV